MDTSFNITELYFVVYHSLIWKCGEMSDDETPVCNASESILYSWAMGAPSFEMPDDVSFKVGYETPYKYFVLQVHYKDAMNLDEKDTSGLELTTQSTPYVILPVFFLMNNFRTGKLAGIYILVSGEDIGPSQIARLDVACSYTGNATLHPFAFRVHTHSHGVLSKGYVVDGNESYLIGSKSPQEHQAARCIMQNNESRIIRIGNTRNDEMCNFYIMYWVTNDNEQQLYDTNNQVCYVGDGSDIYENFQELYKKLLDNSFFPDFEFMNPDINDFFDNFENPYLNQQIEP
ncbi:peptidylglycine monooxygenase [Schistosoma bovis]|uniref:peptidylglycine monooxygenase n=1 Tax=Schistosoma bovis TaxID=6184 RepID=A0A430QHA0_SCHBO|nr:peptidylglycine monooxygenase [Schistosoma bovis]